MWQYLESIPEARAQAAFIRAQIAKYPAEKPEYLDMYELWISTDRRYLPRAGGFLDQPAGIMEALTRIDNKRALVERLFEVEEKALQQAQAGYDAILKYVSD